MTDLIINALLSEANAKEAKAIANLQVYLKNSVGVGEHPDVVGECKKLIDDIASARETRQTIESLLPKQESENS